MSPGRTITSSPSGLKKKLKPLSINEYTITYAFDFADEIRNLSVNEDDILVIVVKY